MIGDAGALRLPAADAADPAAAALALVDYYPDWFPSAQFAGLYVALDHGYYREAGFAVVVHPFAFGSQASRRIAATTGHLALGSIEGYILLQQRARGEDLRVLSAVLQESPAGLISLPAAGIRTARDLSGRRIGVHAYAAPLVNWLLRRAGADLVATPLVPVTDDLGVLLRGEVDAVQGFAIDELIQIERRTGAPAHFLSFTELGFASCSQVLYTTGPHLERSAPALARFVAATRRGWTHALAHPADALAAVRVRQPDADPEFQRACIAMLPAYVTPGGAAPLAPLLPAKWQCLGECGVELQWFATPEPPERYLAVLPAQ